MLSTYTREEKSWMLYDWANSAFATIIAAVILPIFFKEIAVSCGLGSMDMMVVLLVVQVVAFPFAILYGRLAGRFGARSMLLVGIATYIVVCGVGFTLRELKDFLLLAVLVGTAQGGVQALSRSFFGKLIPAESASEYFGFFDVFGKFSAVIGPALFGLVSQLTGSTRMGILPVMSMFILGGAMMIFLVPRRIERIHE